MTDTKKYAEYFDDLLNRLEHLARDSEMIRELAENLSQIPDGAIINSGTFKIMFLELDKLHKRLEKEITIFNENEESGIFEEIKLQHLGQLKKMIELSQKNVCQSRDYYFKLSKNTVGIVAEPDLFKSMQWIMQ